MLFSHSFLAFLADVPILGDAKTGDSLVSGNLGSLAALRLIQISADWESPGVDDDWGIVWSLTNQLEPPESFPG